MCFSECFGVCVFLWEVLEKEGRGLRIIALQSFQDRPSGVLMSQEGFGCCWFPLNGRGIVLFFPFSLLLASLPLSATKVFIDYLVLLFNNLILGDSALCSHRN